MKMLFVDDRVRRISYALNTHEFQGCDHFSEFDITIATNVKEALREMVRGNYDVISLDHDLTGNDFEDPETPTCGMEIVRYISKTGWPPQLKKPYFFIHSSNLFAAHLMVVELSKAGHDAWYKPIIYEKENMKYDEKGMPI